MTRDPLDLLQAANPVLHAVAYPDDEVARRVADIVDHDDGELPTLIGCAPTRRGMQSGLAVPIVAAAVLVLAVVSAFVFARGNDGNSAAGASPVTCAVSTTGGSRAVQARLTQAEIAIGERVSALGGSAHSFVTDQEDGSIGFSPNGVSVGRAAQACRAATAAIRPVVAAPVAVDTGAPRTSNPLAGLTFAVPSTDAAYARLTANQRAQLTAAMSHDDCTHPVAAGLACTTVAGTTTVFLLAPALITGPDVSSARAAEPDTGAGGSNALWTVQLSFRTAGAARFEAFTRAHHTSSSTGDLANCGAHDSVPCADFLAITVNGRAETVPMTNAVLGSGLSIGGAFDQAAAQQVASELTAASIQLHPR